MKVLKIGGMIVGVLLIVAIAGAITYRIVYSQGIAESFDVNSPDLATHILIATQGSEFKEALVSGIVAELKTRPAYIKVIDVTNLATIQEADWQAMVLINTCEMGKMQADTHTFLMQAKHPQKMVLLTTSGGNNYSPDDVPVDSITAASKAKNLQGYLATILKRVDDILRNG